MEESGKALRYCASNRMDGFDKDTVFHEFTALSIELKSMNLGQGFPDWSPPDFVKKALYQAVEEKNCNTYGRSAGHLSLVKELANRYTTILNRDIDPLTQVVTTVGSTEGLFLAAMALLNKNDEVVVFEPAFDIYLADIQLAGAKAKSVPLTVSNGKWTFNFDDFANSFNASTRLLLLNSPHNPTGKVFSREELDFICSIVKKYPNVNVITDEVYEHLVYGCEHLPLASFPGMFERTLTLGSAGKTWSVTGWKIGWMVGPAHLIKACGLLHQWTVFSISTPMQDAIASSLQQSIVKNDGETYFERLRKEYEARRQKLCEALESVGLIPIKPDGTFFVMCDTSNVKIPEKYLENGTSRDYAFCRFLTRDIGVTAIPV